MPKYVRNWILSIVEEGKHIATRASDIALHSAAKIFSINAMSTLHPSSYEMDHWVTNTVITIYNQFKRWTGSRLSPTTCDKFEEIISDEAGKAAIPQWCCTHFISTIIDAASEIGLLPNSQVWQSIRTTMDICKTDLAQRLKKTQGKHPSMTELTKLKGLLGNSAVISQLDRNAGSLFVECPVHHHRALLQQFMYNVEAYEMVLDGCKKSIVQQWRELGEKSSIPGKFKTNGNLPYCYINRKHKDTSRCRPIVAFTTAPHRVQLKYGARAFYFIIRQLQADTFTLWTAHSIRKPILHAVQSLQESDWASGSNVSILAVAADVKDMYSNLLHVDIMAAVAWALKMFRSQTRRDRVNVQRRGQPQGRTGPVYDNNLRVEVTLSSIGCYIEGLLALCFFTCGESILRQRCGIPMGSHISPPLAIVTCMYFEYIYVKRTTSIQRPLRGLRYMDDIIYLTLKREGEDMRAVQRTLKTAREIYPDTMRVLVTGEQQPITFLETDIGWHGAQLLINYANRNGQAMRENGVQRIKRFRHGKSFTSIASLRAVVCCMLERCTRFNTSLGAQTAAVFQLLQEFVSLDYDAAILKDAVHRLARRNQAQRQFWDMIILFYSI